MTTLTYLKAQKQVHRLQSKRCRRLHLLAEDRTDERLVIYVSIPKMKRANCQERVATEQSHQKTSAGLRGRGRMEHLKWTDAPICTPFNSSSTSSSVIFSPSCVSTYRNSPAPINPFPSLSNTWNPRMNSSTRQSEKI